MHRISSSERFSTLLIKNCRLCQLETAGRLFCRFSRVTNDGDQIALWLLRFFSPVASRRCCASSNCPVSEHAGSGKPRLRRRNILEPQATHSHLRGHVHEVHRLRVARAAHVVGRDPGRVRPLLVADGELRMRRAVRRWHSRGTQRSQEVREHLHQSVCVGAPQRLPPRSLLPLAHSLLLVTVF